MNYPSAAVQATGHTLRRSLVTRGIFKRALADSVVKLLPQWQWKNPVMFVVYIGSILTTVLWLQAVAGDGEAPAGFILAVTLWLWFTVLFSNFAEAIAEGRSKAQADALRAAKRDTMAKKMEQPGGNPALRWLRPRACGLATFTWWRQANSFRRTAR